MACVPTASTVVEKLALPELSDTAPSVVAPSLKVTNPVAVPTPGDTALTVVENVTDCPNTDGLVAEATVVVVLARATVWERTALVPPPKLVSPL
jgi:hypothetical protein